jgi:hypothetical protein
MRGTGAVAFGVREWLYIDLALTVFFLSGDQTF